MGAELDEPHAPREVGLQGALHLAETVGELAEIGLEALVFIVFMPTPGTRYADCPPPDVEAVAALLAEARQLLHDLPTTDSVEFTHWFGCYITEPKPQFQILPPQHEWTYGDLNDWVRRGGQLVRHPAARMVWMRTDDRTLVNAAVTFRPGSGSWWVRAFGKNLTDEEYRVGELPVANLWVMSFYGEPLTFGIEAGMDFDW